MHKNQYKLKINKHNFALTHCESLVNSETIFTDPVAPYPQLSRKLRTHKFYDKLAWIIEPRYWHLKLSDRAEIWLAFRRHSSADPWFP